MYLLNNVKAIDWFCLWICLKTHKFTNDLSKSQVDNKIFWVKRCERYAMRVK